MVISNRVQIEVEVLRRPVQSRFGVRRLCGSGPTFLYIPGRKPKPIQEVEELVEEKQVEEKEVEGDI